MALVVIAVKTRFTPERARISTSQVSISFPKKQPYANGFKPKRVDTPAGTVTVQVPKTAGHGDAPFYPHSLERGRRSVRTVMLAVAEMYIKGVSTRDVEAVMAEFGIESLSSSQVSRATRLLDEDLAARAATAHSARSRSHPRRPLREDAPWRDRARW